MAGFFLKQRILVLGSEHFVSAKVNAALSASNWATPVLPTAPNKLSAEHLEGIHAVFNGVTGAPATILAHAHALYGALKRAGSSIRVVHLSSMTVYGSHGGEAVESTPLRTDAGAYGAAQVAAEFLANQYAQSVILRPGCEYGPQCPQWSERIARLLCAHRLGDLGTAGDGICNLLYVDDLVAAVLKSLATPDIDGHCFNLAMRAPPMWNDYLTLFARALGAVPVSRIGARRLKIESRLLAPPLKILELMERRLGEPGVVPPAITPSLLNLCSQNITLNSGKAERLLEIAWTPLNEGLRRAAAAFNGS